MSQSPLSAFVSINRYRGSPLFWTAVTMGKPLAPFVRKHWQFDGVDQVWFGPTKASGPDFSEADAQLQIQGRTFITPQLAFTFAARLEKYVETHDSPKLEKLLKWVREIESEDMLSQRLSGMLEMSLQRAYTQTLRPAGEIGKVLQGTQARPPLPNPNAGSDTMPVLNFAPMGGSFFVVNKLWVIDAFGRTIDVIMGNFNASAGAPAAEQWFLPYTGRGLTPVAGPKRERISQLPSPDFRHPQNPTERMLQLPPRLAQPSQLRFRFVSNDPSQQDIQRVFPASPVCGWIVANHLNRSLSLYAPDGAAWGELFLSQRHDRDGAVKFIPVWQPDPVNPNAPSSWDTIPNAYVRGMIAALAERSTTDGGAAFRAFLRSIDETMWSVDVRRHRQDQNLAVLAGRPLAIVRAELALKLRGLPACQQDWQRTFASPDYDHPEVAHAVGTENGGVFDFQWPVRVGSATLSEDGVIGYFSDDPADPSKTFAVFNSVLPHTGPPTPYIRKIGEPGSYPEIKFTDDTVPAPSDAQKQSTRLTILADPSCALHAFTGILPVLSLEIPDEFVTPALRRISYLFRSGPLLGPVGEVQMPLPHGLRGAFSWFDNTVKAAPIVSAVENATLPAAPQIAREGWVAFQPDDGLRLSYRIAPPREEQPLRAGSVTTLEIHISNPLIEDAKLRRVTIAFPAGHDIPSDLTEVREIPAPSPSAAGDWKISASGSDLILAPKGDVATIARNEPLIVKIKGVRVNRRAGTVRIDITERPESGDPRRGARVLEKM